MTLEKLTRLLEEWRPEIKGTMDDVRLAVKKLNIHTERVAIEHLSTAPGILAPCPSAVGCPPADNMADRPNGNCEASPRLRVRLIITTPNTTRFHGAAYDSSMARVRSRDQLGFTIGKLP